MPVAGAVHNITTGSDTRFQIRRQTFSSLLPPNRELFKSRFAKARKMNDIDPQAWLADVFARIGEHPAQRLDDLLPLELEENVGGQELGSVTLDPFQRKSH